MFAQETIPFTRSEENHQNFIIRSLLLAAFFIGYENVNAQWQYVGSPEICSPFDFDSQGDTLLVLTSSGLFFSTNTGDFWDSIPIPPTAYVLQGIELEKGSLYLTSQRYINKEFKYDVYRSDDWGLNWQFLTKNLDPLSSFIQILIKADTFYYIDHSQIHVSYDRGDHFVSAVDHLGFYSDYYIHHHKLYGRLGLENSSALLRSADDGLTWDTIYKTGVGLYISDLKSIEGVLWKIEHYPQYHLCRVQKSLDDGDTWITTGLIEHLEVGFFDNDPEQIIGGSGQLYVTASNSNRVIYHSGDGGETWNKTSTLLHNERVFYEGDRLWLSSRLGCLSSTDHGVTLENKSTGLNVAGVSNIAPSGSSLFVLGNRNEYVINEESPEWKFIDSCEDIQATRDGHLLAIFNQMPYHSADHGHTWILVTAADLHEPWLFAHHVMCAGDLMYICTSNYDLYYSKDYGTTWKKSSKTFGYLFTYNDRYLLRVGGDILTSDNGINWTALPPPQHPDFHGSIIDVVHFHDPYYFMIADDLMLRLHKDSTTWVKIETPDVGLQFRFLSLISDHNVLFLSVYGGGVYASQDYGESWNTINEGLTNFRTFTLSKDDENLYLGVDGGVWKRPLSELTVATSEPPPSSRMNESCLITNDWVTIDFPGGFNDQLVMQLFSADGRLLDEHRMDRTSNTMYLGDYPPGLYLLNMISSHRRDVKRILKY